MLMSALGQTGPHREGARPLSAQLRSFRSEVFDDGLVAQLEFCSGARRERSVSYPERAFDAPRSIAAVAWNGASRTRSSPGQLGGIVATRSCDNGTAAINAACHYGERHMTTKNESEDRDEDVAKPKRANAEIWDIAKGSSKEEGRDRARQERTRLRGREGPRTRLVQDHADQLDRFLGAGRSHRQGHTGRGVEARRRSPIASRRNSRRKPDQTQAAA